MYKRSRKYSKNSDSGISEDSCGLSVLDADIGVSSSNNGACRIDPLISKLSCRLKSVPHLSIRLMDMTKDKNHIEKHNALTKLKQMASQDTTNSTGSSTCSSNISDEFTNNNEEHVSVGIKKVFNYQISINNEKRKLIGHQLIESPNLEICSYKSESTFSESEDIEPFQLAISQKSDDESLDNLNRNWNRSYYECTILEITSMNLVFQNAKLNSENKLPLTCKRLEKFNGQNLSIIESPNLTTYKTHNTLTTSCNNENNFKISIKRKISDIDSADQNNCAFKKPSLDFPLIGKSFKVPAKKCVEAKNVNKDLRPILENLKNHRKQDTRCDDEMSLYPSEDIIKILELPSDYQNKQYNHRKKLSNFNHRFEMPPTKWYIPDQTNTYNSKSSYENEKTKGTCLKKGIFLSEIEDVSVTKFNGNSGEITNSEFDTVSDATDLARLIANNRRVLPAHNNAVKSYQSICKYTNCRSKTCVYNHYIPKDLEILMNECSSADLHYIYHHLFNNQKHKFFSEILKYIINSFRIRGSVDILIRMIDKILNLCDHNKTPFVEHIIEALTNSNESHSDFSTAVNEVLLMYGRNNEVLCDILLTITTQQPNFLKYYWNVIKELIKFKRYVDDGALEDILKECFILDEAIYYENVCRDLLMKSVINFSEGFNPKLLIKFRSKIIDHHLNQYLDILDIKFCSLNISSNRRMKFNSFIPETLIELTDDDIKDLYDCIQNDDWFQFENILYEHRSKSYEASLLSHLIVIFKKIDMIVFHHNFLSIIRKFADSNRFDDEMKSLLATIGFNMLPIYDSQKKYILSSEIIRIFMKDLQRLLETKCYASNEPYKSNLHDIPTKLVFLFKTLTRGNCYNEALSLIKMKEIDLSEIKDKNLYDYIVKIIKEFLETVIERDIVVSKDAIYNFIDQSGKHKISIDLDLRRHYNMYLMKIINNNPELVNQEYEECIKYHYILIEPDTFRAILVLIYRSKGFTPDLMKLFDHCCLLDIYFKQEGIEDIIYLKSCLIDDEIKIIIFMFFFKRLKNNCSPKNVCFKVLEVTQRPREMLPNILHEDLQDVATMKFRIKRTLACLNPPIIADFDYDNNLTINHHYAKHCMEFIRRTF